MRLATLIFAIFMAFTALTASSRAIDLIPYQADGWKYKQVALDDPEGTVFMDPSFDDSSWYVGQAGFGNGGGSGPNCPTDATVHTLWALQTEMLLRRTFQADQSMLLTVFLGIDNDARVYVNGTLVLDVVDDQCAVIDDHRVTIPPEVVANGSNLLAIRAIDRGVENFVDARLWGEPGLVRVDEGFWGTVKQLYR